MVGPGQKAAPRRPATVTWAAVMLFVLSLLALALAGLMLALVADHIRSPDLSVTRGFLATIAVAGLVAAVLLACGIGVLLRSRLARVLAIVVDALVLPGPLLVFGVIVKLLGEGEAETDRALLALVVLAQVIASTVVLLILLTRSSARRYFAA